jgi:hypothetical protein
MAVTMFGIANMQYYATNGTRYIADSAGVILNVADTDQWGLTMAGARLAGITGATGPSAGPTGSVGPTGASGVTGPTGPA